jgi:GcrA cell cycle regulator
MNSYQRGGWTDERVDLLKQLWSEGLSASQIAGRLGGVTANAVIGKVHRLSLSGHAKPGMSPSFPRERAQTRGNDAGLAMHRIQERAKATARTQARANGQNGKASAARTAKPAEKQSLEEILLPVSLNLALVDLEDGMCHAITSGAFYCGAPTGGKRVQYCAYHARRLR